MSTATHASDSEMVAFLKWACPRLGLRFRGFRNVRGTVHKRLRRRLGQLGIADLGAYRALLEADPSEWDVLGVMCRIPISRFHRDRAVFERIAREILPERARAARAAGRRSVRVWSAGCASGEEPYTIAILWHLDVAPREPGVDLELLATDVDETMIARAERGVYDAGSLRELPEHLRAAAFVPDDGAWRVRTELRRGVAFRREDMRRVMPDGPFDLVLCRNVAFTYFDEPGRHAIAREVIRRLREGGALVVGSHEEVPEELLALRLRAPCVYESHP
jgi:chemotaxis protein methyltransferase CheR